MCMTYEQFRDLRTFAPEFGLSEQTLWAAPLRKEQNRLVAFFRDDTETVFSSELYMDKDIDGALYARINCRWDNSATAVNTIVAGPKKIIQRYANHDHKLVQPLTDKSELLSLSIMKPLADNEVWYFVRPSSFICTNVELRQFPDRKVKFVLLERVIGTTQKYEFFAHIHEAHEEDMETGGFVLSNSTMYIANHPELQFEEILNLRTARNTIWQIL